MIFKLETAFAVIETLILLNLTLLAVEGHGPFLILSSMVVGIALSLSCARQFYTCV